MPNYSESIPELLLRVSKASKKAERIEILQKCANPLFLKTILQGAFHPDIFWDLPEGTPPYKKDDSEYGLAPSHLERELRKLPYFTTYGDNRLVVNVYKREQMWMGMLESIHPTEAELLCQMKEKKIKCRGLSYAVVFEAFPGLLPEKAKVEKVKEPVVLTAGKDESGDIDGDEE